MGAKCCHSTIPSSSSGTVPATVAIRLRNVPVVVGVCHRVLPRGSTDDLLGKTQPAQSKEFALRARIQSNADVLRSATITNADLLQHSDRLGVLKPAAFADLLPVNGDPLKDLGVLSGQGEHLDVIVRGGVIFKNVLQ
jgi:hypothetical protein